MTNSERQAIMDIAELQVNRYFDHYLTDIFPKQMDAIMGGHNQDAEAHEPRFKPLCAAKRRFERFQWMILGGAAVIGAVFGVVASHLPKILEVLVP